jgi:hypothetical protein
VNDYDENGPADAILKRKADEICRLIRLTDYPAVDVRIAVAGLREWCAERLPAKEELFELVYASRFQRLWEQFRADEEPLEGP